MIDGSDGISTLGSSPPLADFVGQALDGFSGAADDGSPEPASPDAGAPPAAETSAVPESTTPAVGTAPAQPTEEPVPAGAPPAGAAPTEAETPPPDDDPAKGAVPLTYTVNGQERTDDAIKVLGSHGAFIEAKDVPRVVQLRSERDHYFEKDRLNHQRITELERLTEWRVKDQQGKETVLSGLRGVEAQRVQTGKAMAALNTVAAVFKQNPVALLAFGQDPQGNATVDWDQTAIDHLLTRSQLAEIQAEQAVRQHLASFSETIKQTAQQQVEDQELPTKLWGAAESAWLSQFPDLTPQDKQFLQAQMPRYVRAAQAGEEHLGKQVIDPSFYAVIQDRAEMRKAHAESLKQTTAATAAADKENKAKLAAAALSKPRGTTPAPSTPATPPPKTREEDAADAWDLRQRSAVAAMRRRA